MRISAPKRPFTVIPTVIQFVHTIQNEIILTDQFIPMKAQPLYVHRKRKIKPPVLKKFTIIDQ